MKADGCRLLIWFLNFLRVVIQLNAVSELQGQEQRMSNFIPDVRGREIIDEPENVWCNLFFIKLDRRWLSRAPGT